MPLILPILLAASSGYSPEIEAVMGRRKTPAERHIRMHAVATPAADPALEDCATLAHKDSAAAVTSAQQWIARQDGPTARQCLGLAQAAAGHWSDAASAFNEGARLAGSDRLTAARLSAAAGNAALVGGDVAGAKGALDRALDGALPDSLEKGEAYLDRARARVALKDEAGARGDLDSALQYAAADPLAWLLSATLARRMNDLPLAQKHIAEAVRLAGDDASVALEQGVIAALSSDDRQAQSAFERAERLAPGTPVAASARRYLTQLGVSGETPKPQSR